MTQLTKEYFDGKIGKLVSKESFDEQINRVTEGLSFLKARVVNIEEKVGRIDKRDKEDSDVFAKDIVKLQKEMKQVKEKVAI